MIGKEGYAAPPPPPPRQVGDRFYNPPAVRRHQQIILQQQQQQMMQMQLLQQQQQQQLHQQQLQQQQMKQQQRQLQRKGKAKSSSSTAAEAEKLNDVDDSSMVAALPVPRSIFPLSSLKLTNLDRLMEAVTPFIEARFLPEVNARGFRTQVDSHPFFCLEDLWEAFSECSVYGRGVPLLLNKRDPVMQFYVPFLSGIQLYFDPSKASTRIRKDAAAGSSSNYQGDRGAKSIMDLNLQRLSRLSLGDKSTMGSASSAADSSSLPLFQFMEHEQPYNRRPLADQISLLASKFPELSKCRSCDLLPSSWICVAWYPIYRIPVGPTLRDLDASFLTFHSLSTQTKSNFPPHQLHPANTRTPHGLVDPSPNMRLSLPVFALAAYKLKGSIVSPSGAQELEQQDSLLQAADSWLSRMHVTLPDYQFFRSHMNYK